MELTKYGLNVLRSYSRADSSYKKLLRAQGGLTRKGAMVDIILTLASKLGQEPKLVQTGDIFGFAALKNGTFDMQAAWFTQRLELIRDFDFTVPLLQPASLYCSNTVRRHTKLTPLSVIVICLLAFICKTSVPKKLSINGSRLAKAVVVLLLVTINARSNLSVALKSLTKSAITAASMYGYVPRYASFSDILSAADRKTLEFVVVDRGEISDPDLAYKVDLHDAPIFEATLGYDQMLKELLRHLEAVSVALAGYINELRWLERGISCVSDGRIEMGSILVRKGWKYLEATDRVISGALEAGIISHLFRRNGGFIEFIRPNTISADSIGLSRLFHTFCLMCMLWGGALLFIMLEASRVTGRLFSR